MKNESGKDETGNLMGLGASDRDLLLGLVASGALVMTLERIAELATACGYTAVKRDEKTGNVTVLVAEYNAALFGADIATLANDDERQELLRWISAQCVTSRKKDGTVVLEFFDAKEGK
ncbi:MAG TPA: hypothetical protein PK384_12705 [Candidatus Latescibacteria bacterium]|nr:hypothetical protein [Candidatus Latescibacterota bacterium]